MSLVTNCSLVTKKRLNFIILLLLLSSFFSVHLERKMVSGDTMNLQVVKPALIFFDTFHHEGEQEEMHLDLVGFGRPVAIKEIRVISQGCRIHSEIKDKVGETSPTSFKLEVFAKNLNKPNATVFEKLGTLEYKDGEFFQLITNSKIATNVVLLRGWYTRLTVSLYGEFTEVVLDNNQVPPPPPPQHGMFGMQQPAEQMAMMPPHIAPNQLELERQRQAGMAPDMGAIQARDPRAAAREMYERRPQSDPRFVGDLERRGDDKDKGKSDGQGDGRDGDRRDKDPRQSKKEGDLREREKGRSRDKRSPGSSRGGEVKSVGETTEGKSLDKDGNERGQGSPQDGVDSLFEPLSPETDFFDMPNDGVNDEIGYEDIESDEDNFDDFDFEDTADLSSFQDLDLYGTEDTWMSVSVSFNPYQCDLSNLESFEPLGLSDFDIAEKSIKDEDKGKEDAKGSSEAKQLMALIKEFKLSPANAKWVTMLEELPPLLSQALAFLKTTASLEDALDVLIKWIRLALDIDVAMKLPIGVNIRQLKAGIKLASCLCRCNEEISKAVMVKGVQHQLIKLLTAENMASSIRLLVIQALDSSTDMTVGMEYFLGWNLKEEDGSKDVKKTSVYEEIVMYLLTDPAVRVVTAIKRLLRKVHFYESLANLQSCAERLCTNVKISQEDVEMKSDLKEEENDSNVKTEDRDQDIKKEPMTNENSMDVQEGMFSNDDLDTLIAALDDVFNILESAKELIAQPALKNFPTSAMTVESPQNDCNQTVFSFLRKRRFLEAVLIVMSSPVFCEPALFSTIRNLLFFLLDNEKGLIFLSSEPSTVNGMIRVLTQTSEAEGHYSEAPSLKELKNDPNAADNCVAHHLGLLLIYHLQSLQGIDQLIAAEKKGISPQEMDDADNLSTLHTLYSMTFTPIGKVAVTSVLSQRDNLKCLMPFVEHQDEGEGKPRRSVSSKYATVLLLLTMQISDNIKSLGKFGSKLLAAPKRDNDPSWTELGHYLAPLGRIINIDVNAIANLVEYIKGELETFKTNASSPRGIYTALRLLKYICIAPESQKQAEQKDLKWNLAVIQLFSANAMDTCIQLLNKLGERLVTPWRQNQAFSSHHCFVLVSLAVPLLQLVHKMLIELIDSGKVPFKDTRLLHGIFVVHTILCSRPVSGQLLTTISQVQSEIVAILLKFTTTNAPESQDALRASPWFLMLKELVQYAGSKPQAFLSGVVLLSEVLPVPFPVHSMQDLSENDITALSNYRLLWMAHIGALGNEIQTMLKSLVGSCCNYLQHALRKLCLQLCDLGALTSLSTIRVLCEILDDLMIKINKRTDPDEDKEIDKEEDSIESNKRYAARVASILSSAVSQPGGKLAFLHLTRRSDGREGGEFVDLFESMLQVLYVPDFTVADSAFVEGILGILVSLCDSQIAINEFEDPLKLENLANNLPTSEVMQDLASNVFSFICNSKQQYQAKIAAIRVLILFTDHDFGMQILECLLENSGHKLYEILKKLEKDLSNKDSQVDVMNVFSTLLGFLQLLLPPTGMPEGAEQDQRNETYTQLNRKIHIPYSKLKSLLKLDKLTGNHPFSELERFFKEECKEDENAEPLLADMSTFTAALRTKDEPLSKDIEEAIVLPKPDTVQNLYNKRIFHLAAMLEDDRLAPMLWFLSSPSEDVEIDSDMIKVDLEAVAETYCPGFNLKEEVEKGFITTDDDTKRTKRSRRKYDPLVHGKGNHVDDLKRQRLDVSWLQRGHPNFRGRGRGFGRGYVDMFRARKQNTSRPPSMHVDDFIMMEHTGSPSSDAQNKQPIKSTYTAPVRTATSEPRFTGGFSDSQGRWASPAAASFRRDAQHTQINRGGFGTWSGQSTFSPQYARGGGSFQRGGSSWSPQIPSPYRAPRESQATYARSSFRGGYWAGPKPKEDSSRFFPATGSSSSGFSSYRQSQGNGRDGFGGRHFRTFTK